MLFGFASPSAEVRPIPDWAKVHTELRRPNDTLMLCGTSTKKPISTDPPIHKPASRLRASHQWWIWGCTRIIKSEKSSESTYSESRFPYMTQSS